MIARWAKPVIPIAVEPASKTLVYGGHWFNIPTFILEPDDIERIRLGYVCMMCLEPHEVPYPEKCAVCPFPMRAIQDEVFAVMYEGEAVVGPTTSLADEWEAAKEAVERGGWASADG